MCVYLYCVRVCECDVYVHLYCVCVCEPDVYVYVYLYCVCVCVNVMCICVFMYVCVRWFVCVCVYKRHPSLACVGVWCVPVGVRVRFPTCAGGAVAGEARLAGAAVAPDRVEADRVLVTPPPATLTLIPPCSRDTRTHTHTHTHMQTHTWRQARTDTHTDTHAHARTHT